MEPISRGVLTFLLNSLWQIPLIAVVAAVCCRLLRRGPASQAHIVWAAALMAAVAAPLASVGTVGERLETRAELTGSVETGAAIGSVATRPAGQPAKSATTVLGRRSVPVARTAATVTLGAYLLFVVFRLVRFSGAVVGALRLSASMRFGKSAEPCVLPEAVEEVMARCRLVFGLREAKLLVSNRVSGPVTTCTTILLPPSMAADGSPEMLEAAIGHEAAHIARGDFFWRLLFELLYAPVSFHPAAWLIRRGLEQTREIACDELVAARLLRADVYARAILRIAEGMARLRQPRYTLGVFDGDILEERIRRLMEKPMNKMKRSRLMLAGGLSAVALCAALACGVALSAYAQSPGTTNMRLGAEAYNRGDFKAAIERFQAAVNADPKHVSAKLFLANACLREYFAQRSGGDAALMETARRQYEDAFRMEPRNTTALRGIIAIHLNNGRLAEAREEASRLIQLDSKDKEGYYLLAFTNVMSVSPAVLNAQGTAGVRPRFTGHGVLDVTDVTTIQLQNPGTRASLRLQVLTQLEEGLRLLRTAIEIDPNYSAAIAWIGQLHRMKASLVDDPAEALELARQSNEWLERAGELVREQRTSATGQIDADGPPPAPVILVENESGGALEGTRCLGWRYTPVPRHNLPMRLWITLIPFCLAGQTATDTKRWLDQPLLDAKQPLVEVQVYTAARVPVVPTLGNSREWDRYAAKLRQDVLDKVVLRGEAKRWRSPQRKIEWTGTLDGPGYRVKKVRFEVVPGLWTSAVLYEPERMTGKIPAVLNVNGHEGAGISTGYIQERCINLAKKGMLAFNAEWLGKGQLNVEDLSHYKMNYLDLAGTSGLAVFYLMMERSLDILLAHDNVDRNRVAVTGLSGGGWQTTMITALDTRVKLSVPVAGHSSFVTRAQWPTLDMGDSEQTPTDLGSVADYLHLTAMTAPRPLMLINNAKDNCCFRADYAMAPLLQTAERVYALYNAEDKLRYYINHSNGHNYDKFSREELYRFLKEQFGGTFDTKEIPSVGEIRKAAELASELPANNETFRSLALKLMEKLPRGDSGREELTALVHARQLAVDAREINREGNVVWWQLKLGRAWTVPAVEIGPANAADTVILLADAGRGAMAQEAAAHIAQGRRVLAVDPFYVGESKIATRDYLFAMQIAALGERPLGLQASQLTAIARWIKQRTPGTVQLETHGRRTSLMGLVAAAIEPAISRSTLHGGFRSLKQAIDENLTVEKYPELFCFGLLEKFDIPQMARLGSSVSLKE